MTDEAARSNAPQRFLLGRGAMVWLKLTPSAAGTCGDLHTECSAIETSFDSLDYGTVGSTRLDILEDRRPEGDMVCVYDIKTGRAGLSPGRLLQISLEVNKHFGAARFIVIEVRPFE